MVRRMKGSWRGTMLSRILSHWTASNLWFCPSQFFSGLSVFSGSFIPGLSWIQYISIPHYGLTVSCPVTAIRVSRCSNCSDSYNVLSPAVISNQLLSRIFLPGAKDKNFPVSYSRRSVSYLGFSWVTCYMREIKVEKNPRVKRKCRWYNEKQTVVILPNKVRKGSGTVIYSLY